MITKIGLKNNGKRLKNAIRHPFHKLFIKKTLYLHKTVSEHVLLYRGSIETMCDKRYAELGEILISLEIVPRI